ncbi:MAG: hypothetical protein FD175_1197 [Beijerinckiaceae bacterium]|nr:MAG: hypothetical protein FD175_1197 [Beijerinckiaceae bacterium]
MSSKSAAVPDTKDDNEPSMEEILASIRKIIADDSLGTKKDEAAVKKAPPPKAPEPEPMIDIEAVDVAMDEDDDVLDLANVATVASAPQEVSVDMPAAVAAIPEMSFDPVDVAIPPAPMPQPVQVTPINTVAALEDRIISDNAGSLVGQAFQALSRHTAMPAVGRSLEDVVVELIRPMLRGWIDDNLPGIVEKLVKTEIERVARGG